MRKLKKNEKVLVSIISIFVVAFLVQNLILLPFFSKLKDITTQVKVDEKNLTRLFYLDFKGKDIEKTFENIRPYLETGKTEDDMLSVIMKKIEELASECDITLLNMKPDTAREREETLYESKKVELSIEGSQRSIIEFLYKLENSKYSLRVNRLDFKIKDRDRNLMEADLNVDFIYFLK
jgi:hypothetical protein